MSDEGLRKLVDKWRSEAIAAVPPEYADRELHSKYLRLDNAAAGKDECADELESALATAPPEQAAKQYQEDFWVPTDEHPIPDLPQAVLPDDDDSLNYETRLRRIAPDQPQATSGGALSLTDMKLARKLVENIHAAIPVEANRLFDVGKLMGNLLLHVETLLASHDQKVREDATLAEHQSHIDFENELYATLVDPVAEGPIKEAEMRKQLLEQARWYRQRVYDLESENQQVRAALQNLLNACVAADANEELSELIDGSLLDAARAALAGAVEKETK